MQVIVRVNYTAENLSVAHKIIEDLSQFNNSEKSFLRVDLQKVWQEKIEWKKAARYVQSITSKAKESGIFCRATNLLNYVKDSCYGNKRNHILINYNGDAYCCTARDFTKENRVGSLDSDGAIAWDDPSYLEKRMQTRLNRPSCLRCRIAPICGGGCRQNCIERLPEGDYCMYDNDDERKDHFVMVRFERMVMDIMKQKQGN